MKNFLQSKNFGMLMKSITKSIRLANMVLLKIMKNFNLDINNDAVFSKIGFPKNLIQLIGKSQDLVLSNF